MKLSVSLPDADVATIDAYVRSAGLPSRSAALQHAVRMLRLTHLEDDYATAWAEWDASGDRTAWDAATGDAVSDAAR
jgi:Arc/MetJ-type ribon-helix-helix transcriptional regulator